MHYVTTTTQLRAMVGEILLSLFSLLSLGACQVHFDCPPLPPLQKSARNVNELRPQDIKVVMALGDSVTAGRSRKLRVVHKGTWARVIRAIGVELVPYINPYVSNSFYGYLCTGFGMMGSHGLDVIKDLNEYRVKKIIFINCLVI